MNIVADVLSLLPGARLNVASLRLRMLPVDSAQGSWVAAYVAASNLGIVPLTGQNMPFLGLNAWSDVSFVGAMLSAMVVALWRAESTRVSNT